MVRAINPRKQHLTAMTTLSIWIAAGSNFPYWAADATLSMLGERRRRIHHRSMDDYAARPKKPWSVRRESSIPARCSARTVAAFGAALGALAIASAVLAVDDVAMEIGRIEGAGWRAQGLTLSIAFVEGAMRARVKVAELSAPSLARDLRDVQVACHDVKISTEAFACSNARVALDLPGLAKQEFRAGLRYGRSDGALDVALDGVRLAQGSGAAVVSFRDAGWTAAVDLKQAPLDLLLRIARDFGAPSPLAAGEGLVTLSASARGSKQGVEQVRLNARLAGGTVNNESGSIASDKLSFDLIGEMRRSGSDRRFAVEFRSHQGQAYAQPIFLDLGAHRLAFSASGVMHDAKRLTVEKFSIDHADVAQAHGRVRVDLEHEQPVRMLDLQIDSLRFPGAYESFLQPLLLDTSFKAMTTAGGVAGRVVIGEGGPASVDLRFDDLALDDGARNFALSGLTGRWVWSAKQTTNEDRDDWSRDDPGAPESNLQWRGGLLLGLQLGAGHLRFSTNDRQFHLLQPTRIPVLDGALDLTTLRISGVGTPKAAFLVDAVLQPISVQRLCKTFGWPEFGGQVGGAISKLQMREGVITLGTTLQAQVFDGSVEISDLRLEQPFGQWPKFHSTIALRNLDLELVTSAFAFGRITGRLSGAIDELQLFNWTPVAFDARLYTAPGDRSRHRISQRAVENIGSIGGSGAGVAAALSSGFLRFFEDFNYDRLGWSCRLENEICRMNGVGPAPNGGYYLVKGKGLPRIDVIGNAKRVDWPRLVAQLIAITESKGPVVQ
jgi:hypothetical protein